MVHSEKLDETALWKEYKKKADAGSERCIWVKKVYEYAANYLKDVRRIFENYTLHDETHILNVLDAMGGLLGDQISNLTVGELELLILVASLHDVGMVYTDEEQKAQYEDTETCKKFLREHYPEFLGSTAEEWTEDMRQWYLRSLHSERVAEVLHNEAWKELISQRPIDVVPFQCIVSVCEAHGYNPSDMVGNHDLDYLNANDVSPLFCALLLRLGDLLDFDDTRAPKVLYSYVGDNEKSIEEWKKHQASAGFFYPASPSTEALPYKAHCTHPGVEHAIRDFLDWIEVELGNCIRLQKSCRKSWQQNFPFPRTILRNEIESDGYMSGDFCITMDQTKILELLTGENLYDNRDVFVRELLQNAIDATLLRGKMDSDFIPEKSRIDFWEWNDKDGNIWFRIDDEGTGMTMGMLQRYFLKVGNSYYSSKEIERDLRDHHQTEKYYGISRFGIGFLSCFLNGDYAEVSTLYFDSDKNRREEETTNSNMNKHYGLRLQVTGLSGYYTLLNQSQNHFTNEPMPNPGDFVTETSYQQERNGYRKNAGTSIAICLNPGKLGTLNLKNTVEKYLCGSRVPVYYNNERIGQTYEEIMEVAHAVAGEKVYELTDELKEQFDQVFPELQGKYPQIVMTTIPLDTKEDHVLYGISGVLVKYDVRFEKSSYWQVKDLEYSVNGYIEEIDKKIELRLFSSYVGEDMDHTYKWWELKEKYGVEVVDALANIFEKCDVCPQSEEQLGEVWSPFRASVGLFEMWKSYHDNKQDQHMRILLEKFGCPNIISFEPNLRDDLIKCAYQGVYVGSISGGFRTDHSQIGMFFLEDEWKPTTQVSRAEMTQLPLEVGLYICGVAKKYSILGEYLCVKDVWGFCMDLIQKDWRKVRILPLKRWLEQNQKDYFEERSRFLKEAIFSKKHFKNIYINNPKDAVVSNDGLFVLLNLYQDAYLQAHNQMKINYEKGQVISFFKKKKNEPDEIFELFPPMLFCKAASEKSRKYLCCVDPSWRKGITLDHPFVICLMKNAILMNKYYQRQFKQIIDCLRYKSATVIIVEVNAIRQQLISLPEHHGVDVYNFPQLSRDDFWYMEDDSEISI